MARPTFVAGPHGSLTSVLVFTTGQLPPQYAYNSSRCPAEPPPSCHYWTSSGQLCDVRGLYTNCCTSYEWSRRPIGRPGPDTASHSPVTKAIGRRVGRAQSRDSCGVTHRAVTSWSWQLTQLNVRTREDAQRFEKKWEDAASVLNFTFRNV